MTAKINIVNSGDHIGKIIFKIKAGISIPEIPFKIISLKKIFLKGLLLLWFTVIFRPVKILAGVLPLSVRYATK